MANNLPHKLHVVSDYEAGLIAVGVLSVEDVDSDYQHYARNYNHEYGLMSHCEWSSMVCEWHSLNKEFTALTGGSFANLSKETAKVADELCDRMGWIEWYLGV